MNTNKIVAIIAHCDELTEIGKELSVSWEGGDDEGWFYLRLDGRKIHHPSMAQQDIIDHVEAGMDISFAGDSYCQGRTVYNRKTKEFVPDYDY